MKTVKPTHFIFDLGGVIINLDVSLTMQAFARLTECSMAEVTTFAHQEPAFLQYEKGEISSAEFRSAIRKLTKKRLSDGQVDHAWNAMILDLPEERIELLRWLGERHDIYLLSNTNDIHMQKVNQVCAMAGVEPFHQLFRKDYYSHLMGKRKPDADCFLQVVRENGLNPAQTLFLDDNEMNIQGAAAVGLQTLHVTSPSLLQDYFSHGQKG